jgi:transposase-like protein
VCAVLCGSPDSFDGFGVLLTHPDTHGVQAVCGHTQHLHRLIRDTNAIEALNRQLRKAIKTKGHFPNEDAARKLIYLAVNNAVPAWTRTRNWTAALLAFKIHF